MREVRDMMTRADAEAEGFLAQMMADLQRTLVDASFTDSEIIALRETFKAGWLAGYRCGLEETVTLSKKLNPMLQRLKDLVGGDDG